MYVLCALACSAHLGETGSLEATEQGRVWPGDGRVEAEAWLLVPISSLLLPFDECGRRWQCLVELVEGEAAACGLELGERGYLG